MDSNIDIFELSLAKTKVLSHEMIDIHFLFYFIEIKTNRLLEVVTLLF